MRTGTCPIPKNLLISAVACVNPYHRELNGVRQKNRAFAALLTGTYNGNKAANLIQIKPKGLIALFETRKGKINEKGNGQAENFHARLRTISR